MEDAKSDFKEDRDINGVRIMKVCGHYTVSTTGDYYKICSQEIQDKGIKAILLDFEGVKNMDTAGFACMINFIKEVLCFFAP